MTESRQGARIYNFFPLLAGPIPDWYGHLDRIAAMGFDWLYVNPFHYPGFSGSLYAVKDFYALHPLMDPGQGQPTGKVLADFVAAARERGLRVMMDLVVNHTGKDSLVAEAHPEWFVREPDGSLHSPGAIDPADARKTTVWADLAEIDYGHRPELAAIVEFFRGVVRHFAALGFSGFRCDAAYKVPGPIWQEIIGAAREVDGDAVFLAETLGARLEEVEGLRGAGFDYLYNSAKWWDFKEPWLLEQYESFRSIAPSMSFPETHDTARFAAELKGDGLMKAADIERAYKQHYFFAAVFSTAVMMPMGYEYGFERKLDVVKTRPADWETPTFDLTGFVADVNRMKASLTALNEEGPQHHVGLGDGYLAALTRRSEDGTDWSAALINGNLSMANTARIEGLDVDLAAGREVTPGKKRKPPAAGSVVTFAPGEFRLFAGGATPSS